MFDSFRLLFDTSAFPARWECGQWSSTHGWFHIVSDIGIWSAYTAIPIVLFYFVRRRKDIPFSPIIVLFAAFILFCGFGHLIEAGIFWWPAYRFSAAVKLCTAVVSWLTVLALIRVTPTALTLPGLARVNNELARTNRELNDYARVISHDLKAPLRGIRSLSEWIQTDLKNESGETRENLELLRDRVDEMQRLIDGVLAYSRVGDANAHVKRVDSAEVLEKTLSTLVIPENVNVEIANTLPSVRANETRLHQVFANLLSNAFRYASLKGGTVRVGVRELPEEWRFHVQDDGPGIPPEQHDRVFRMFQKLDMYDTTEGQTGIGLTIAKKVVETGGGRIWLDSNFGEGCTVYFTVPKEPVLIDVSHAALADEF